MKCPHLFFAELSAQNQAVRISTTHSRVDASKMSIENGPWSLLMPKMKAKIFPQLLRQPC